MSTYTHHMCQAKLVAIENTTSPELSKDIFMSVLTILKKRKDTVEFGV
jgi:hypothetical protein